MQNFLYKMPEITGSTSPGFTASTARKTKAATVFGMTIALYSILLPTLALSAGSHSPSKSGIVFSNGKKIHVDQNCDRPPSEKSSSIIFLHGSGGPQSAALPYLDEEKALSKQGYCIFAPHYLDSTGGMVEDPQRHYSTWVQVVEDTADYITASHGTERNRIVLIGYSLGASVALGAAAKHPAFGAVVEFSGSLPDQYLPILTTFPPLLIIHGRADTAVPVDNAGQLSELCRRRGFQCETQLYIGEGHAFSIPAMITSKRVVEQFLRNHLPAIQATQ